MIRLLYRLPSNVAGLNLASLSATPASSEAEARKRDSWAADLEVGLARSIKDMDNQIRAARRAATAVAALEDKLAGQRQGTALEVGRNRERCSLFDAQDELDR